MHSYVRAPLPASRDNCWSGASDTPRNRRRAQLSNGCRIRRFAPRPRARVGSLRLLRFVPVRTLVKIGRSFAALGHST
jgi:hypothetical protein